MKYGSWLLLALFLVGCNQQKITQLEAEIKQIKEQNKLIAAQSAGKDQFIEEYTTTLNDVYDNLENIRKREGLITSFSQSIEGGKNVALRDKMLQNARSIDTYILHSKKKLNTLREHYKQAQLNSIAFEKTIEKLTLQLEKKERYILSLRSEIDSLSKKMVVAENKIEQRDLIIEEQSEQINLAYFIIGSNADLEAKQIITQKGGLLGFGQTTVVSTNLDDTDFEVTDISKTEQIPIDFPVDEIEIISAHAPSSFILKQEDEAHTVLEILDPSTFWKMRYLVIATKS